MATGVRGGSETPLWNKMKLDAQVVTRGAGHHTKFFGIQGGHLVEVGSWRCAGGTAGIGR